MLLMLLLLLFCGSIPLVFSASVFPNILIVLADDQGYGDVGFNAVPSRQHQPGANGPWIPNPPRTPNLDMWATDSSSILFSRAYSGSPVCSPTRSSVLTGRTPDRECVFNAEGCGQVPAWSCVDPMPFPFSVPTLARTLQSAGFNTMHLGKFHLGDFFPKTNPDPSYAYLKWPVMNPGMIGFQNWFSTEASASSSTLNCGCEPAWPNEPPGCIVGGGEWVMGKSLECTNFWGPADVDNPKPECHSPKSATLSCVMNSTVKVEGDSTMHMLEHLSLFINSSISTARPFFAAFELHTNHVPHPSLPEFYHLYNDSNGLPAGDYLGTLTQMDASIGSLRKLLFDLRVDNSTLVWFLADNGSHPGKFNDGAGGVKDVQTTTNGLRQCKASVFEGGIRVPSFISWRGEIHSHFVSDIPIYALDIYPTILDLLNISYPEQTWIVDGESILSLLQNDNGFLRTKSLGWRLEGQVALMDHIGQYKLVKNPEAGQCELEKSSYSYNLTGYFLFDIIADPIESTPLNELYPEILASMIAEMEEWEANILVSEIEESQCLPPQPPKNESFYLVHGGQCLGAASASEHAKLTLTASNCKTIEDAALTHWALNENGALVLSSSIGFGLHPLADVCADGTEVVLGNKDTAQFVTLDVAKGTLSSSAACPGKCVTTDFKLSNCSSSNDGWSSQSIGDNVFNFKSSRGRYIQPYD